MNKTIKTNQFLTITLTHDCTRNCVFCIDKNRGKNLQISTENFIKALKFAKEQGMTDIILTGGEPTLHPDFIGFCQLVKCYGFKLIVITNCDLKDIIYRADRYVDAYNFSDYGQELVDPTKITHATKTISKILIKGGIDSKQKLDDYIDKYSRDFDIKFSVLAPVNEWSKRNKAHFVNRLKGEKTEVLGGLPAKIYRNCLIKLYDCRINGKDGNVSYKALVNGKISKEWGL